MVEMKSWWLCFKAGWRERRSTLKTYHLKYLQPSKHVIYLILYNRLLIVDLLLNADYLASKASDSITFWPVAKFIAPAVVE